MAKTSKDQRLKNKLQSDLGHLDYSAIKKEHKALFDSTCKVIISHINNRNSILMTHQDVIDKIKTGDTFVRSDDSKIKAFIMNIGKLLSLNNLINNINSDLGKIIEKGNPLNRWDLFNILLATKSINAGPSFINRKCNGNLVYIELFSVLKFFQDPDNYPLNYRLWRNLSQYVFGVSDDYDELCKFYRNLPHGKELICNECDFEMFVYMDCIKELIGDLSKTTDYKDFKSIVNKQFLRAASEEKEGEKKGKKKDAEQNGKHMGVIPDKLPLNLILYGPPGTGKTYHTVDKALEILGLSQDKLKSMSREEKLDLFDDYKAKGRIVFTTFHQSMGYEDFVEGIKPKTVGSDVHYETVPGILKKICDSILNSSLHVKALKGFKEYIKSKGSSTSVYCEGWGDIKVKLGSSDEIMIKESKKKWVDISDEDIIKVLRVLGLETNPKTNVDRIGNHIKKHLGKYLRGQVFEERYALIIDEINRGNVSQIFGELITLIEDDKRLGNKESVTAQLPYSGEDFGVPNNLYIIGTMNTADRSVEALDTALRRRFSFKEMMPKYDAEGMDREIEVQGSNYSLKEILETLNARIKVLKGREYQIGHSYLMKCRTDADLKAALKDKIIPLLQEYFYGDYAQIGLVLGQGFVQRVSLKDKKKDKSLFAIGFDAPDLEDQYELPTEEWWLNLDLDLKDALDKLLRKDQQAKGQPANDQPAEDQSANDQLEEGQPTQEK